MDHVEEAVDDARRAYLASRMSSETLTLKEAATLVDRSVTTLRKWIRQGDLQAVTGRGKNGKSTLLVDESELMTYVATSGKRANPGRKKSDKGPSKEVLRAELEGQRALVTALQGQLVLLEGQLSALEEAKRTERERAQEWKDRSTVLDAELRALRGEMRLPWWKRLLTVSPAPAIEAASPQPA